MEAREIVCAGCKAQTDHGKTQKEPRSGAKVYVVDTRPEDVPLRPWSLPAADPPPPGEPADRDDDAD